MNQVSGWSGRLAGTLLLGTAMALGGCKHAAAPAAGVPNSDGSVTNADGSITYPAGKAPNSATPTATPKVNADGSTTNPDGSVTYPAGSRQASKEAQAAAAPAPGAVAAPMPAASRVIPADTPVRIITTGTLSASRNEVGDSFEATLAGPIEVRGERFFERGTRVTGTVVASKHKGRFKGAGDLGIELTSIGGVHVSSTEYEAIAKGNGKRTGGFIGGGGGLGAIIGGIAGGGKGALIGGLAGAGAGTAASAYTGSRDVVIRPETTITFRLTAPVNVK